MQIAQQTLIINIKLYYNLFIYENGFNCCTILTKQKPDLSKGNRMYFILSRELFERSLPYIICYEYWCILHRPYNFFGISHFIFELSVCMCEASVLWTERLKCDTNNWAMVQWPRHKQSRLIHEAVNVEFRLRLVYLYILL